MNKRTMYSIGIVTAAVAGLAIVPSLASAQTMNNASHGNGGGIGYQQVMQTKAELLGMTKDELSVELQSKTLLQIAEEKGVSIDKLHETMGLAARQRWADRGLNQTEIDSRLKAMAERQAGDHETNSANRGYGMGQGQHRFNQ